MANKKQTKKHTSSNTIVILAAVVIGLIAALILFNRPSFLNSGAWDCDRYNITVARDGIVTVVNASANAEPATAVEVYIDNVLVDTLNAPALAPGQQATIGGVTVPGNGAFTWRAVAVADRRCDDRGSYEPTPSPTPTLQPTPTTNPTVRPTPTLIGDPTPTPTLKPTTPPVACKLEMNFERLSNGSVPVDNTKFSRGYEGITFSMKNPASNIKVPSGGCSTAIGPRIAQRGSPRTAYQGYKGADDTSEPYNRTGQFVLTDDGKLSPTTNYDYACTLRFDIDNPDLYTRAVSLDILDIDKEGYAVKAYASDGRLLDTTTVAPTIPGNGIAYKVSVVSPTLTSSTTTSVIQPSSLIAAVEVVPNAMTKADGWGWAIDNICLK